MASRAARQIVALPAPVLPEPITERISEQSEVIEVTAISSQDRELQRTVEQTLVDFVEVGKIVILERISESICEHSRVIERTETSSQDQKLQRTVERAFVDFVEVDKTIPAGANF